MERTKLTVNLSEDVVDALRTMADKRGITLTEALRQAIANAKYLQDEQDKGSKILIEDQKKSIQRLVFR